MDVINSSLNTEYKRSTPFAPNLKMGPKARKETMKRILPSSALLFILIVSLSSAEAKVSFIL